MQAVVRAGAAMLLGVRLRETGRALEARNYVLLETIASMN